VNLKSFLISAISVGLIGLPSVLSLPAQVDAAKFDGEEQVGIDVYKNSSAAVVTISTGKSNGSGSIVSPEGLVLTNEHVVRATQTGEVMVITSNGNRYNGRVIAIDRNNDLALVQIQSSDRLPALRLADNNGIQVGQRVYAIGSPYGLSGTLTTGILSRIGKGGDLQTDAALNPGNSGGPLLNSQGELIGVNKSILSPGQGNVGIGFATSAVVAQDFIQQNRYRNSPDSGNVATAPQPVSPNFGAPNSNYGTAGPRLGVTVDATTLIVQDVAPNSLALSIGIRPGDRILAVNGQRLTSAEALVDFLEQRPNSAILTIARNRRVANVQVKF
jgi:serine protease Do